MLVSQACQAGEEAHCVPSPPVEDALGPVACRCECHRACMNGYHADGSESIPEHSDTSTVKFCRMAVQILDCEKVRTPSAPSNTIYELVCKKGRKRHSFRIKISQLSPDKMNLIFPLCIVNCYGVFLVFLAQYA